MKIRMRELKDVIFTLQKAVAPGGMLLANYPDEPRYLKGITNIDMIEGLLGPYFGRIERLTSYTAAGDTAVQLICFK